MLDELTEVHQFVLRNLSESGELMWNSSMPRRLPTDETIPLGRYGSSHSAAPRACTAWVGPPLCGRRMQTISGIHYNWSLPGVSSDEYFALIRNFRRNAFVLLYLYGASPRCAPALSRASTDCRRWATASVRCTCLMPPRCAWADWATRAMHSPASTSLQRAGWLCDSLHEALTRPYPAYEQLGAQPRW
ncbi:hypothetical protein J4714_14210 [Staphylococcus epidermidis]|nr:hypothetical protein [Staphylococcus epidermidis]